jgi:hypothetical protein
MDDDRCAIWGDIDRIPFIFHTLGARRRSRRHRGGEQHDARTSRRIVVRH